MRRVVLTAAGALVAVGLGLVMTLGPRGAHRRYQDLYTLTEGEVSWG